MYLQKKEVDYRKGFMYRHHDGKLRFTETIPTQDEKEQIRSLRTEARKTIQKGDIVFYENGIVLINNNMVYNVLFIPLLIFFKIQEYYYLM